MRQFEALDDVRLRQMDGVVDQPQLDLDARCEGGRSDRESLPDALDVVRRVRQPENKPARDDGLRCVRECVLV